jgi:hypothetical protein
MEYALNFLTTEPIQPIFDLREKTGHYTPAIIFVLPPFTFISRGTKPRSHPVKPAKFPDFQIRACSDRVGSSPAVLSASWLALISFTSLARIAGVLARALSLAAVLVRALSLTAVAASSLSLAAVAASALSLAVVATSALSLAAAAAAALSLKFKMMFFPSGSWICSSAYSNGGGG